ncbi:VanZ family protein [Paenibacillus curdlanolyticus YK9]|uniref:VanZ family protein n=1 Tax=Paenibacillus curdlanolyticus YK9 TaxID=717606 RepID=E0IB54_9BACL|nr:VanZ family protein [Paenibacillus curdlanolyticus]EFM10345.1 VanZ family protein [Paenibacillus curdlanolyticus YK9]
MRIAIPLLWCAVLFVCTCTMSFKLLLQHFVIEFHWDADPNLSDLFRMNDVWLTSKLYLLQKIGHFSGFFILTLLLISAARHARSNPLTAIRKGVMLAAGYAVLTEVLQLYFGRDGRIIDMFIDGAGIALAARIAYRASRGQQAKSRQLRA